MVADARETELRDELKLIDKMLAGRRQELTDLKDELRDSDDGAAATRMLDEQEAIIASLEARRAELLEMLSLPLPE